MIEKCFAQYNITAHNCEPSNETLRIYGEIHLKL